MLDAVSPLTTLPTADTNPVAGGAGVGKTSAAAAATAPGAAGEMDFGSMLGQMASDAAAQLRASEQLSIAGIQGKASVQQVVDAVMSAEQTLQGAIAIRDKVVSAYLEISRMSI
ncbi:MAG TPA: flagellar hook-basal body complex protein FliE [Hyphomicrobiaceae bacterium]|jgi:flagellar hook-basal body complex protein FliE|nr:flagellar hook-basal body complex protein FliE [Hyphomicrobiaceae bacterium]